MKHFGTDGIRALSESFTEEYLQKIAYGIASLGKDMTVSIGRDPRTSGPYIEEVLVRTLTKHGVNVISLGMVPTPVLAYLTRFYNCDYGIMLSASHNPPEYNGIKLFSAQGEKVSEESELQVESIIENPVIFAEKKGTLTSMCGDEEYIRHYIDLIKPDLKGVKVLMDTANGATSIIAPGLFAAAGAVVTQLKGETDGIRINDGCGATVPRFLLEEMKKGDYDIGFTFDGDGDRVMCVKNGKLYNGDHLMYVHSKALKAKGALKGNAMVGTIMSNLGTERACEKSGIKLVRANVGDKYVFREMKEHGCNVGGEESGHVIFSDYVSTGDGMISALLTACLDKETAIDTLDDIVEYPSVSDSIVCNKEAIMKFKESKEIREYLASIGKEYRTVIRPSGTEPKIRILVESEFIENARQKAQEIKDFIKERIL